MTFLSSQEFWASIHGMALGALFPIGFAGGLVEFWCLRPEWAIGMALDRRVRRLRAGTWLAALVAWLIVVVGTYVVYPWYRAAPSPGVAELAGYAQSTLQAGSILLAGGSVWLDWKERVAWLGPLLATSVALIVGEYRQSLIYHPWVRQFTTLLFGLAFIAVVVAGSLGSLIAQIVPVH